MYQCIAFVLTKGYCSKRQPTHSLRCFQHIHINLTLIHLGITKGYLGDQLAFHRNMQMIIALEGKLKEIQADSSQSYYYTDCCHMKHKGTIVE